LCSFGDLRWRGAQEVMRRTEVAAKKRYLIGKVVSGLGFFQGMKGSEIMLLSCSSRKSNVVVAIEMCA